MQKFTQFLKEHSLSLVVFGLFFAFLIGQSISGHYFYNEEQMSHGEDLVSYWRYIGSSHFLEAVFENWESEFLQMGSYIFLTAFLFQKGSAESKSIDSPEDVDREPNPRRHHVPWPVRYGGFISKVYEHSLSIAFLLLFALSFLFHAISGAEEYCNDQVVHGESCISTLAYMGTSRFWFESFQNWQSEYLAVGAIIVLSIFLRQKGSPESKPVDAPHNKTGS